MMHARLPVAVIGAGPVGLAAAAHLLARGETPLILEAGRAVAHGVRLILGANEESGFGGVNYYFAH